MTTICEEELVEMHKSLIYKIANQFYNVDKEDLFQEGANVLKQAYENYHKDGTVKFSTYVYPYIYGAMCAFVMGEKYKIKVTKDVLREYKEIEQTRYSLAQKLQRVPTYDEVAIYLEKDVQRVNQIVTAATRSIISMDSNEETQRSMYETIPSNESVSLDDRIDLQDGLDTLSEEEKKIIEYRYFHDLTQSEVARRLNKTQVMISRYEKRVLGKIRSYLGN